MYLKLLLGLNLNPERSAHQRIRLNFVLYNFGYNLKTFINLTVQTYLKTVRLRFGYL